MAVTKKKAPVQKRKKQAPAVTFFQIAGISLILIVILKHSFIFLLAGMLPSIVAWIVDRSRSKLQFRTVAAMNFSGVAPYMAMLIKQNNSTEAVQAVMATPEAWLVMYSAAGFGWGIVLFTPYFIRSAMNFFSDNKIHKLEAEQKELIEEWGTGVASDDSYDLKLTSDSEKEEE